MKSAKLNGDRPRRPTASVVVPAWNAGATLAACLESLLSQDFPAEDREIIVVDNDSIDNTAEIASRYPVRLVFEREVHTCAGAKNRGIREAQGGIIAMIDSDATAAPEWLAEGVRACREGADIVGGAVQITYHSRHSLCEAYDRLMYMNQERYVRELGFSAGCNTFARREVFDGTGLYLPGLRWSEDVEWAWRATAAGFSLDYCPKALIYHPARGNLRSLLRKAHFAGRGTVQLGRLRGHSSQQMIRPRSLLASGVGTLAAKIRADAATDWSQLPGLLALHNLLKIARLRGVLEGCLRDRTQVSKWVVPAL